jgi:hypothetical protein
VEEMRPVGRSHRSGREESRCGLSVDGEVRRNLGLDERALVVVFGLGYASKYVGFLYDGPEESNVVGKVSRGGGDLSFSRLRDRNEELLRGTRWGDPVPEPPRIWGRERTDCIAIAVKRDPK